jgi:DNA-binding transcriptional ArsR family regulator
VIRVELDASAMGRIRILTSPLWEAISSLELLAGGTVSWPYSDWSRGAQSALAGRPAEELVQWARRLPHAVPAVLTPAPTRVDATFSDEVDQLYRLPEDDVRAGLDAAGAPIPEDVGAWLQWFAYTLTDYWESAVEPHWSLMRGALQSDLAIRAHAVATQGVASVLSSLESRIRWSPPRLLLEGAQPSGDVAALDGLTLVPLLFGRTFLRCVSAGDGTVAVSCQARGAVVLGDRQPADGDSPRSGDRLSMLLGRGRAEVLRSLLAPTTTTILASQLRLAPATVSQHLGVLVAAGVVQRQRVGTRVMYELGIGGVALLRYLDRGDYRS